LHRWAQNGAQPKSRPGQRPRRRDDHGEHEGEPLKGILLRTGTTVAEYVAAAEQKGHKRGRIVGGLRLFEKDKHIALTAAR